MSEGEKIGKSSNIFKSKHLGSCDDDNDESFTNRSPFPTTNAWHAVTTNLCQDLGVQGDLAEGFYRCCDLCQAKVGPER